MKNAKNIQKLIKGTLERKIKWKKRNPTTFNWMTKTSEGIPVNIIIQKYTNKEEQELSLRIWDLEKRYDILEILYTKSDEKTKNILQELYELISDSSLFIEDIFSDILRDI